MTAAVLALAGVIPVAYLCVGYPVAFEERPLLSEVGWRERPPLAPLAAFDGWEGKPGEEWADLAALLAEESP